MNTMSDRLEQALREWAACQRHHRTVAGTSWAGTLPADGRRMRHQSERRLAEAAEQLAAAWRAELAQRRKETEAGTTASQETLL